MHDPSRSALPVPTAQRGHPSPFNDPTPDPPRGIAVADHTPFGFRMEEVEPYRRGLLLWAWFELVCGAAMLIVAWAAFVWPYLVAIGAIGVGVTAILRTRSPLALAGVHCCGCSVTLAMWHFRWMHMALAVGAVLTAVSGIASAAVNPGNRGYAVAAILIAVLLAVSTIAAWTNVVRLRLANLPGYTAFVMSNAVVGPPVTGAVAVPMAMPHVRWTPPPQQQQQQQQQQPYSYQPSQYPQQQQPQQPPQGYAQY